METSTVPATSETAAATNGHNGHIEQPSDVQSSRKGKVPNMFDDFMGFNGGDDKDDPEEDADDSAPPDSADALQMKAADAAVERVVADTERELTEIVEAAKETVDEVVDELEELFGDDDPAGEGPDADVIEREPVQTLDESDVVVSREVEESMEVEEPAVNGTTEDPSTQPVNTESKADDHGDATEEAADKPPEAFKEEFIGVVGEASKETKEEVETTDEPVPEAGDIAEEDGVAKPVEGEETADSVEPASAVEVVEMIEVQEPTETAADASAPLANGEELTASEPLNEVEDGAADDALKEIEADRDVSMAVDGTPGGDAGEEDAEGEDELMEDAASQDEGAKAIGGEKAYSMPGEDGFIHFTRSDGQSARLPGSKKGPTMPDRMEVVARNSDIQKSFLKKVGQGVAVQLMGLTGKNYALADLPKNYRLYQQWRTTGEGRPDVYLFGAGTVPKFRSTAEFVPHAIWLLTDPTLDPKNCQCAKDSKDAGRKGSGIDAKSTPDRPLKRKQSNLKPEPAVKKIKLPDPPIPRDSNNIQPKATRSDREADLASSERLEAPRAGELVWVNVDPPIQGRKEGELIEFWPCTVAEYEPSRKLSPAKGKSNANAPPAWLVRALGTVHNTHVRAEAILPYQAYDYPQATKDVLVQFRPKSTKWDTFMRFYPFPQQPETEAEKPRTLSKRRSMPDLTTSKSQRTFANAAPALVLALQMCGQLDNGWATTDGYHHPVPAQNVENPPPVSVQAPSRRFEGVFWGAERIWEGDFVRLNVTFRTDLPENDYRRHLYNNMTSQSDGRGLFMLVNAFHYLSYGVDAQTAAERKECWMAGPVFETVFDTPSDSADDNGETNQPLPEQGPDFDLVREAPILSASALGILAERKQDDLNVPASVPTKYPWPPAPSGFKFRPLLAKDEELYVNISCLAGRYYPTIFFKQLLIGRHDMAKSKNGVSTPQLLSLSGFMPGYVNAALCEKHYRERAIMFTEAEEQAKERLEAVWRNEETEA